MRPQLLINGDAVAGQGEYPAVVDPATENEVAQVAEASLVRVDTAAGAASTSFKRFSRTTPKEHANLLLRIADILKSNSFELADLESLDVGKPWAAIKGSGTGCEMSIHALDAYTSIRHVMVSHG